MRCTIENKHVPALRALCMHPNHGDPSHSPTDDDFARIEVREGVVNVESPFGSMTAESRAASEPGVAFVPLRRIVDALESTTTSYYIEISASPRQVTINGRGFVPPWDKVAVFSDPENAPRHWRP